jgi:thiosulfate/3-mercaptopyruvate sulfurtransferase
MAFTTLVQAEELASHLGEWRVFDCRHDLAKPEWGEAQYRASHIPGALFAHLDRDLSAPKTGKNGRHPLPSPDAFAAWLGKQGLKAGDQVVCYDASNGATAARPWWMLRWVGHEAVAVLDGGFAKWVKEGRPVTRELPAPASSEYPLRLRAEAALDVRTLQDGLKKLLLIDARAPVRYRGEQEPIDPVAGRIPGALNRFNMDNVNSDGTFKNSSQLKQQLEAVLKGRNPAETVHYCGSGVAACHNLLAMELAGLPGGKLYAGSWSEWSADPGRPREKS